MFGFGSAFKTRTHYVFDYKPRYYDERKERLEKIKEKYAGGNSDNDEDIKSISFTKNNLRDAWKKTKKSRNDTKSTRRLALIITILVGIVVYIFDLHSLF